MNCKQTLDKKQAGLNLYRLIDMSEYTYDDIADFLGLRTSRVIYDWLGGKKLPTVENLMNLALLLGVRIEDILF